MAASRVDAVDLARGAGSTRWGTGSHRDWLVQVVALCLAAAVWQRFVGKGPLEWVVRRLSVWGRRARA